MKFLLSAVALSCAFATGAMAQSQTSGPDIVVSGDYLKMNWERVSGEVPFGDLNLKDPKGVEMLNARVEAEANRLCGVRETTVKGKVDRKTCMESMMASARPQVDQVVANAR